MPFRSQPMVWFRPPFDSEGSRIRSRPKWWGSNQHVETRNWLKPEHNWLVVWNTSSIFPYIGNFIIPIDSHIFQRGSNHQPDSTEKKDLLRISERWWFCQSPYPTQESKLRWSPTLDVPLRSGGRTTRTWSWVREGAVSQEALALVWVNMPKNLNIAYYDMPYVLNMCQDLGRFYWGKCWQTFHTWSIWDGFWDFVPHTHGSSSVTKIRHRCSPEKNPPILQDGLGGRQRV